jgi:hypothetical protein
MSDLDMTGRLRDGFQWQCQCCGKKARDLYGDDADYDWDESCILNAMLIDPSGQIVDSVDQFDKWRTADMSKATP